MAPESTAHPNKSALIHSHVHERALCLAIAHRTGHLNVAGVSKMEIESVDQALQLIAKALNNRCGTLCVCITAPAGPTLMFKCFDGVT